MLMGVNNSCLKIRRCQVVVAWQAYLDSNLRQVVGVTQRGGDVEAELLTVLNGGVSKPDAQ